MLETVVLRWEIYGVGTEAFMPVDRRDLQHRPMTLPLKVDRHLINFQGHDWPAL